MTGKLRSITFSLSMVTVLLAWAASSLVAENRVNKNKKGLALRGFDAVAYFEPGKPVKGSDQFTHKWNGATWRFASAGHRDQFAADPEQYAPQFGGYCAFAVTQGSTVDADPKVWRVLDGKLYLNYSQQVQRLWGRDVAGNIKKANAFWPKLQAAK